MIYIYITGEVEVVGVSGGSVGCGPLYPYIRTAEV